MIKNFLNHKTIIIQKQRIRYKIRLIYRRHKTQKCGQKTRVLIVKRWRRC